LLLEDSHRFYILGVV